MASRIYILSNPRVLGEYKLGVHTGNLRKLQARYETYIPDVTIHYLIENVKAAEIEQQFKELHSELRVPFARKREGAGLSEWFKMPLHDMITCLLIMLVGKNYGFDGRKNFTIIQLLDEIVDDTRIIRASPQIIDLTSDSDTDDDE